MVSNIQGEKIAVAHEKNLSTVFRGLLQLKTGCNYTLNDQIRFLVIDEKNLESGPLLFICFFNQHCLTS